MKKKLMCDNWAVVIAPTSITDVSIFFPYHVQAFEKYMLGFFFKKKTKHKTLRKHLSSLHHVT